MTRSSQALRFSLLVLIVLSLLMSTRPAQAQTAPKFTVLHNFTGAEGSGSSTTLSPGLDGNYYGTADLGGAHGVGTVFKITCSGTLTTLHNFTGGADGEYPIGKLTLGFDGNFYGTTFLGGTGGAGTVFKITPSGTFTLLHIFNYHTDGGQPQGGLNLGLDGKLYGVTGQGGAHGDGTVFTLQVQWF